MNSSCGLLSLKTSLRLQYFGHLMQRTDSLEETLMLGKIKDGRRRGKQRMIWSEMDMSLSKLQGCWWTGKPGILQSMGSQRVRHDWATELNWTWGREDAIAILWLGARDAAKHCTMHRVAPTAKIIQPKLSTVPPLRSPHLTKPWVTSECQRTPWKIDLLFGRIAWAFWW